MILKFPRPYPDETFYSWIARYHERSANYYAKTTVESVFDSPYGCAIYNLPTGLKKFCSQLLPLCHYDPAQILQFHTSLPYYSSTFPKQRIENAKSKMLSELNIGIYSLLGTQASIIAEFRYFKYCPDCLTEDTEQFGEPYWHRVHQLPGVVVCPHHCIPTLNSVVDKQNSHTQFYASAGNYAKPNLVQKNILPSQKLTDVAAESLKLLSRYRRPITSRRYRNQLLGAGFDKGDLINQVKLAEAFLDFWPQNLLTDIGVPSDLKSKSSWLKFITRNTRQGLRAHPLQHILLRLFLKNQIPLQEPLQSVDENIKTYPCPNPFCKADSHNSATVTETYRHSKTGPLFGIIQCRCGFSFSCNLEVNELYTRNVIQYGKAWDKKFSKYVQQGHSIHKLEQLMSVSRPVIKKKALELDLSPEWLPRRCTQKAKKSFMEKRAQKHKQIFLQHRNKNSEHTLKELRCKINSTIKFLYRYERNWLNQHKPTEKQAIKPQRIDWKKRDQKYLRNVQSIVTELLNMPGKPQKITLYKVSKIFGQKNIFSKIPNKIPLTMNYLEKACDKDQYITRRLKWAALRLSQTGESVTRRKILQKAAIRYTPSDQHETLLKQLISNETTYKPPEAGTCQVEPATGTARTEVDPDRLWQPHQNR